MKFALSVMVSCTLALCSSFASAETNPAASRLVDFHVLPPVRIWAGEAPGMKDWPGRAGVPVEESSSADGANTYNVVDPSFQAYLPDPKYATGTAVIIAPGGGFRLLSIESEGRLVAKWLSQRGVAAFVLKYRLVQREENVPNETIQKQIQKISSDAISAPATADGIQALKLIRAHAKDYGIDPNRVGAIGFSAGGHVASLMGLNQIPSERANFVASIYGAPFSQKMPDLPPANLPPAPEAPKEPWLAPAPIPAPGSLPPFFLAMAQDDVLVGQGFRKFYDAMYAAGYRPELHLYLRGGHGFGMKHQGSTTDHFVDEFYWWLESQGLTQRSTSQ